MLRKYLFLIPSAAVLAGCQTTGDQYQEDVFDASQVNSRQEAKTVKIITVTPARIKVSNENSRQTAQLVGGLLGAVAGGALGHQKNTDTALIGAAGSGAAGVAAGSLVSAETLVPGVLISYQEDGKIFTSAQVGKLCEFAIGEISILVKTKSNEARIQPNASCPVQAG